MTERETLIALAAFIPFGPARIKVLRKYFGSAGKLWSAHRQKLLQVGLSDKLVGEFISFRQNFRPDFYFIRVEKLGAKIITIDDKNYSKKLKEIDNPPTIIYVKGEFLPRDEVAIAIVGSRKITGYGRAVAEKLSMELAAAGVTVVSGLALGVDGVAHRAALSVGGRTVAVIGSGIDTIYPPSHRQLAQEIVRSGCILSEYPVGYPALPINFPNRNRIISGLSLGVVVIEGTEKSGTLLTAAHAAAQGREVFAVPGPITSPNSAAPHILLGQGAKLVTGADDILQELKIGHRTKNIETIQMLPRVKEEGILLEFLTTGGVDIDTLVRMSGLGIDVVLASLIGMELKGLVKNNGGIYVKI